MDRNKCAVFAIVALAGISLGGFSSPKISTGGILRSVSMHAQRADHSATLLPDGRVLLAGGMVENGVFLDSAELFDPQKQTFVSARNMLSRRVGHSATLLPNGKVLIAGGLAGRVFEGGPGVVASTELFDPATGSFTAGPSMSAPRSGHAAVLLANRTVLIVGGADQDERILASAEIYDPVSNRFTPTASMHTARIARPAVLLRDGRVLVTGGGNGRGPAMSSAEIFDPQTSKWSTVGDMISPREKHAATLLADGRVLITGGSADGQWHPVRSAEIFDPRTNRFTLTSEMQAARFKLPDATVKLKDGRVLIAGGAAQLEVFDAAAGTFSSAGDISTPNYFASATRLPDGSVLIAGGYGTGSGRANGPLSTDKAWIYHP
jgi:hypothetical protein